MKIIITEDQMDKFIQKMKNTIEKYGFLNTVKMIGIDKLKLAKLTELPVKGDTFQASNEIVVGDLLGDIVKESPNYKTCELDFDRFSKSVRWDCKLKDEDNYYNISVYATPYWVSDKITPVELIYAEVTPINSPEDKNEYDGLSYYNQFDCPSSYNNVNELIDWFENTYKPQTYSEIVDLVKRFKSREL